MSVVGGDLNDQITKQGDLVRGLKAQKASKGEVDEAVKVLLALKQEFKKVSHHVQLGCRVYCSCLNLLKMKIFPSYYYTIKKINCTYIVILPTYRQLAKSGNQALLLLLPPLHPLQCHKYPVTSWTQKFKLKLIKCEK